MAQIKDIFRSQKGTIKIIENYQPILNLCACSKFFEKLMLMCLRAIKIENNIDLTNKSQHGFKQKHSALMAGLQIQSLFARAIDRGQFAFMSSLDTYLIKIVIISNF